jgi:hypothetical protein
MNADRRMSGFRDLTGPDLRNAILALAAADDSGVLHVATRSACRTLELRSSYVIDAIFMQRFPKKEQLRNLSAISPFIATLRLHKSEIWRPVWKRGSRTGCDRFLPERG